MKKISIGNLVGEDDSRLQLDQSVKEAEEDKPHGSTRTGGGMQSQPTPGYSESLSARQATALGIHKHSGQCGKEYEHKKILEKKCLKFSVVLRLIMKLINRG